MASVSWKKLHGGGEAAAMIGHAERKHGTYKNSYIDPLRADDNYTIGSSRFWDWFGRTEFERLKDRVAEIDKQLPPKRIRKDRVTLIGFTIPAPEGLPPDREQDFFEIVRDAIGRLCGGMENVSHGWVHRDEIHDYIDAYDGMRKTSRAHMHIFGVPYVPGVGVNGKRFETRQRLQTLNKEIDRECHDRLAVGFLTHDTRKRGLSVEELQDRSVNAAQKAAQERLRAEADALRDEVAVLQRQALAIEADIKAAEKKRFCLKDKSLNDLVYGYDDDFDR